MFGKYNDGPTNKAPENNIEQTNAYEMVTHPSHYNKYSVEVIEMMKKIYGEGCVAIWDELTAFKYRMRLGEKPNNPVRQDLQKEEFYISDKKKILREHNMDNEKFKAFINDVQQVFNGSTPVRIIDGRKQLLTD